jgi:hypothetical protein
MGTVHDRLRDADPLRHEPALTDEQRGRMRHAILAAAREAAPAARWFRAPLGVLALVAAIVAGVVAAGTRAPVYAAVHFEVRLAETEPAPGLHEAHVAGSGRTIYLHDEVIVSNDDVERVSAVTGTGPSRYNIGVEFNAGGAEKMRRATLEHEGRPLAILIDGDVVMAPVIRSPVTTSALITGDYSKADAERIINGIGVR